MNFNIVSPSSNIVEEHRFPLKSTEIVEDLALSNCNSLALFSRITTSAGYNTNVKSIKFFDILNSSDSIQSKEYLFKSENDYAPRLHFSNGSLFCMDGGLLGHIGEETTWRRSHPSYAYLSINELRGATIGRKTEQEDELIFWDMFTFQKERSVTMQAQGRKTCEMLNSNEPHMVVTLHSGTFKTKNVLALWDRRANQPLAAKKVMDDGRDIISLAVIETSTGPRMVTRSTNSTTIDFRSIFDGAFGELILNVDPSFGNIDSSSAIPNGSGPWANYCVSLLSSSNSLLNTGTKKSYYTGNSIYSDLAKQVTIRTYDLGQNILDQPISPKLTIEFSEVIKYEAGIYYPEKTFALNAEKMTFVGLDENKNKNVLIYKI